jgi:uncharacterized protein (DUF1697 family)
MSRVVAFLRGINVGNHMVKKEKLQEAFVALGFQSVITYKQSGNIIFETEIGDMGEVRARIEGKLRKVLGYEVPVFLRTIPQLKSIVEKNSRPVSEGTSLQVTLLPGPASKPALPLIIPNSTAEVVSSSGSEFFSLTHGGGEGALPNPFLESKLKVKTTTRNMNVLREIVEKFG